MKPSRSYNLSVWGWMPSISETTLIMNSLCSRAAIVTPFQCGMRNSDCGIESQEESRRPVCVALLFFYSSFRIPHSELSFPESSESDIPPRVGRMQPVELPEEFLSPLGKPCRRGNPDRHVMVSHASPAEMGHTLAPELELLSRLNSGGH